MAYRQKTKAKIKRKNTKMTTLYSTTYWRDEFDITEIGLNSKGL